MDRPLAVVSVIVRRGDKILVGKRGSETSHTDVVCTPGGKWEGGETLPMAALRELRQETGLVGVRVGKANWYSTVYPALGRHYLTFYVEVTADGEPENLEPTKNKGWYWATPADIQRGADEVMKSLEAWIEEHI